MFGVFDSGFGGFQTLKYLKKVFPEFDYIFYADNKNVPYGIKSPSLIKKLTFLGVKYLFDNGSKIVLIACNTASAYSMDFLKKIYPNKIILSIIEPAINKLINMGYKNIGIIGTSATVNSSIYPKKFFEKTGKSVNFYQISAPSIVQLIEDQVTDEKLINYVISSYLKKFPINLDVVVLGCTHYPIYKKYFKKILNIDIIDPAWETVLFLENFFKNNPDVYNEISKNGKLKIIETGKIKFRNKIKYIL